MIFKTIMLKLFLIINFSIYFGFHSNSNYYLSNHRQDLFGGDGVFVKQSAVTAPPIEVTVDSVSGVVVTR